MSDTASANKVLKESLSVVGITDELTPYTKAVLERLSGRQNIATQSVAWLVGLAADLVKIPGGKRNLIPEVKTLLAERDLDFDPPAPPCNPLLDVLVSHYLEDIRSLVEATKVLRRPDLQAMMQEVNGGNEYIWWNTPEFRKRLGECDSEELMRVLKLLLPDIENASGLLEIVEDYFKTTGLGKKR